MLERRALVFRRTVPMNSLVATASVPVIKISRYKNKVRELCARALEVALAPAVSICRSTALTRLPHNVISCSACARRGVRVFERRQMCRAQYSQTSPSPFWTPFARGGVGETSGLSGHLTLLTETSWFWNPRRARYLGTEISGGVCQDPRKPNENSPYPGRRPPPKSRKLQLF